MLTRRLLLSSLIPAFGALMTPDDEPTPTPTPLFAQIFPEPTGKNGLEEIIRAGDRLTDAKAWYPNPGSNTLSIKRGYVADPACRAALSLLRQGMRKPIELPSSEESPFYTSSGRMRPLARLLSFRVYVGFADGENAAVVGEVLSFLRFADAFKGQNLVQASVGGGLERSVLTPLTRLRDSWGERDCVRLLAFAKARANAPDPALVTLARDREMMQTFWQRMTTKPEELAGQFESLSSMEETEGVTKAETFEERLRVDSGLRARVWKEMPGAINGHYDRAAVLLGDPTKRLFIETPAEEKSRLHEITLYLRDSLVIDILFLRLAVENRLNNQFLAAHAAIRRYRWENDRLPKTLDELNLPANITTDPYSAKPLLYEPEPTGTNYRLASAGALVPGKDGKPDARERFALPREYPTPVKTAPQ